MADPSATGEILSDLVTGPEIDFRPKTYEHGSYRFNRLLPVQGPLSPSLSSTNVTVTTIELPAKVFNLAKSVLRFSMQVPAQANSTTNGMWVHADTVACIDRLSLFTRSGVYLADLTNFNTFMKVTNKWTQSKDELKANDVGEMSAWGANPTNTTWTNGFQTANSPPLDLPQQLPFKKGIQNINRTQLGANTVNVRAGAAATLTSVAVGANIVVSAQNQAVQHSNYRKNGNQMPQAIGATGTVETTEQRYLFSVGRANTQACGNNANFITTLNYLIKFGQIPHSIFSMNKDLYFGETLILQINWAPTNRIAFQGTAWHIRAGSGADDGTTDLSVEVHPASTYLGYNNPNDEATPIAADPAAAVVSAAPAFSPNQRFQLSNVECFLAVESNRALIETIVRQMSTAGLRLLVPYTIAGKYTSTPSTTQNVQQRINRAWGRTLLRVYHSVFNNVETEIHAYNNYNVGGTSTVQSFYSTLDNDRLQEVNLSCVTQDDYLFLQEMLKGTAIQSAAHYQSGWTWVDDWTGASPSEYRKTDNGECGLTLAQERLWQIYMTMAAANAFNHYSFFVTQKMLTITPTQITLI